MANGQTDFLVLKKSKKSRIVSSFKGSTLP